MVTVYHVFTEIIKFYIMLKRPITLLIKITSGIIENIIKLN